jgi:serine/threonine-protein kinase HipA
LNTIEDWIKSEQKFLLDPHSIILADHNTKSKKTSVYFWTVCLTLGKNMMKRGERRNGQKKRRKSITLYDIDFLLGVYDEVSIELDTALQNKSEGDFFRQQQNSFFLWSSILNYKTAN